MGSRSSSTDESIYFESETDFEADAYLGNEIGGDNIVTNTVTDLGAIEAGLSLGEEAIQGLVDGNVAALEYYDNIASSAFELVAGNTTESLERQEYATKNAMDFAANASKSEDAQNMQTAIKWGLASLVLVAAAWAYRGK